MKTAQEAGLNGAKDKDFVEYVGTQYLVLVIQEQKPSELAELMCARCVLVNSAMIAKVADAKIKEKLLSEITETCITLILFTPHFFLGMVVLLKLNRRMVVNGDH